MIKNIELKMNEIKYICKKHELNMDHFWLEVNRQFNLKQAKNAGNREKRNGTPIGLMFEIAVALPLFCSNSVYSFFNSQYTKMITCGAIPFYRFFQDSLFDWRKVLYQFNVQLKHSDNIQESETKYPTALIIDDTVIQKTGKRIEGVTKVHDHVTGKSVTGFKLLGLCWFNGFYTRFLDFSLVGEKKIKLKRSKPQFNLDLEKLFDRVNHDILMSRIARKIEDKRVLKLIRSFLEAGIMADGIVSPRDKGTPQGGPLSSLLSNILLDESDKELERRGHCFCRYADDCNIYVYSRKAGERVLESITGFLENKLKLKVNQKKSAVARPWKRKFLGYSMTSDQNVKLKAAPESVKRLKGNIRAVMRKGRGRNLHRFIKNDLNPKLRGWVNYFRHAETKGIFQELDMWIRHRLRNIIWRQWKRSRTRWKKLRQQGLEDNHARNSAYNGRGPWWNSGAPHMNKAFPKKYFDNLKLVSLLDEILKFRNLTGTAVIRNRTSGGVRG